MFHIRVIADVFQYSNSNFREFYGFVLVFLDKLSCSFVRGLRKRKRTDFLKALGFL